MDLISLSIIISAGILACYLYLKIVYLNYWKRKGIPYIEPEFYYGNTKKVFKGEISFGEQFQEIYREFKARGERHGGLYMSFSPQYIPIDPEIVKSILQKDFNHFVNHGLYANEEDDPLTAHLFNMENAKWRDLRAKLTPTFTSGKMKMMFQTLVGCSDGLEEIIRDHSSIQDVLDVKEIMARFTTDVIGCCAFGLECNSLKNPNSEFRKYGKKIFEASLIAKIKLVITLIMPAQFLKMIHFRTTNREVESFFMNVVKDTIEYREKNNVFRKDFVHLMLQLKNKGKVTDGEGFTFEDGSKKEFLSLNEFAAQCFVFFSAGFETSSTTITFALYELSVNQNIQDKLRDEIRSVIKRHDDQLTYEGVMEMSYLDKVVNETLRMHSPVSGTQRVCNKAYTIPGTDIVLEAGTTVHIPILGLQTDPEYYPNPEVFDPERFNEEHKAKRPSVAFIPFGDGPRICIGLRFGLMQSKVGLIRILKDYRVTLNKKTKTPIKMDPRCPIPQIQGGVWLNVSKVN